MCVCVHLCVCACLCEHTSASVWVGGVCVQDGERGREREESGSLRVSGCVMICLDFSGFVCVFFFAFF